MRLSLFRTLVAEEFGAGYAASLVKDLTLGSLGSRTAEVAIAQGVSPRTVWIALCDAMDVPPERRLGRDPADKPGRATGRS